MTAILWFEAIDRNSLPEAGGKGANLGEMTRAGLPVPPGFVVAASAYREHLDRAGLTERIGARLAELDPEEMASVEAACEEIGEWITSAPVPDAIREAVRDAYITLSKRMGRTVPVAVRSSATAEDLPDASFAGQQETFLGVRGEGALLEAVQRCWASLWAPRAVAYRARMGYDHLSVSLAVVVQTMVPSEVAGVMFTVNPLTGARGEYMITAAYGLGESVVGGLVTPDIYRVTPEGRLLTADRGAKESRIVMTEAGTETLQVEPADRERDCLSHADLAALATLGRKVSQHYGAPQDTEWALAGGKLYLLQARPITTMLPAEAPPAPAGLRRKQMEFLWQNLRDHFPDPPRPMDLEVMEINHRTLWSFFASVGFHIPKGFQVIYELADGRMRFTVCGPTPTPAMLWRLPGRIVEGYRSDALTLWETVRREAEAELSRMEEHDLSALDESGLCGLVGRVVDGLNRYLPMRFRAIFAAGFVHEALLRLYVRRALGRDQVEQVMGQLMQALPYHTAEMNREIAGLAAQAQRHGIESAPFTSVFERFLTRWGNRPTKGMEPLPSFPVWREEPSMVLGMVRAMAQDPGALDGQVQERSQQVAFEVAKSRVLSRLGSGAGRRFLKALEATRRYLIAREDSLGFNERYVALLRRVLLALGERFADLGRLGSPDEIFYLRLSELTEHGLAERVERRKRAYSAVCGAQERGTHWTVFTGSTPPPARIAVPAPAGDALTGFGTSQGQVSGPVCIVRGPADFGKLKRGDILVAPMTAPAWTPLFRIAAAVVTDTGGPLSHAAIVAREYGIPAVLATGSATARLRDGQVVTVDGTGGWVSLG